MKDVTQRSRRPGRVSTDADDWRALIEDIAEERGYFDPLGTDHAALFTEPATTLLVSFENADGDPHAPARPAAAGPGR